MLPPKPRLRSCAKKKRRKSVNLNWRVKKPSKRDRRNCGERLHLKQQGSKRRESPQKKQSWNDNALRRRRKKSGCVRRKSNWSERSRTSA